MHTVIETECYINTVRAKLVSRVAELERDMKEEGNIHNLSALSLVKGELEDIIIDLDAEFKVDSETLEEDEKLFQEGRKA